MLPRRLGKYHVLEQIAQGGMAEIYRAKTVGIAGFEKILALKRISPHFAREPRFIRSFVDEARIAVTLNHRNIVQVFDFGKADGDLYMAMELIEGVDLRAALASATDAGISLPTSVACYILADLAAGLDYAHHKTDGEGRPLGIVHCDVSPQNVMLSYEGFVKILDFGVARARFANPPREKRLRGKPRYMAPEQTRGEAPTSATDVFALGILAWELLTGLPLFEGTDLAQVLRAVRRADAPPVSRLNPEVPEPVSLAIARALALPPPLRGDAGELGLVLARTARELTHLPSSRAIAEWLAHVYAGESAAATGEETFGRGRGGSAASAITRGGPDGWAYDEPSGIKTRGGTLVGPGAGSSVGAGAGTGVGTSVGSTVGTSVGTGAGTVPGGTRTSPAATSTFIPDMAESGDEMVGAAEIEPSDPAGPIPSPALVENRRVVATAVVVDGGQPETQRELVRMLAELAYKHGALLHSHAPDGLVAVFGLEVAGEDDIAGAMQYSLDAVELARETAQADLAASPSIRIATRAGIAAQKSAGSMRVRGDAIEEARLLARGAEPSRPLLTGGTGRVASAQFAFRELPARRLRSRRLRVLELVGARDYADQTRALRDRRGRFVGRAAELERLGAALERALSEKRRVVIAVVGGAGAGKSRLVAEFVARVEARAHPPALVAVAASPAARDAPFWLIGDFLQSGLKLPIRRGKAGRGGTIHRLRHVLDRAGMERTELDECLAAVELALELRDGAIGTTGHASADLRDRVAGALRSVRVSLGGALLVVLEDMHLADLPSLDVLRGAGRLDPGIPELVVMTSREREQLPLPDPDATEVIDLGELGADERTELVIDRLAELATPEAVAAVTRRAGGNPLFIEELASAVRELGRAQVPSGLRDVLMARVDRLPVASKAALQHAAVIGPVFRRRILEELLGPEVHQHLQELIAEELVAPIRGEAAEVDEGELAFRNDLLQEVVYESLAGAARRHTHARLGRLLAERLEAGREEPPLQVARHLELGGERELAAAMWLRAGQVALAAYDAAEARTAFNRVLELDRAGPVDDPKAARGRRVAALLGREQAYRELGEHDAQLADLSELERLADCDPLLEAEVGNRRATRLLRLGDYAGAVTAARAAERAAEAAGDERIRGEALRVLGEAHERTGQFERGLAVVEEALAIFRRIGAAHEEMQARIGIGRNHLTCSRYEAAWSTYEPILERLDESADPWLERVVRNHVAVIHLCLGDFEAAMGSARRSMELCDFYGDRARAGDNLSVCGIILTEVGQFGEARDRFDRALAIHHQTGSRWSRADCMVYAGANESALGRFDRALLLLGEAISIAREMGARYVEANGEVALSGVLLRRGQPADAERAVEAAERGLEAARAATLIGPEILALSRRGEALLRLGRLDQAVASTARAVELLEEQRYLEGSEEEVLYAHHLVLERLGDPAAAELLARARGGLDRKLQMLTDPDWQRSFVDAIALHRSILGPEPDTAPS
ncbi:MAG TPA: protein kinase [Kofleriaceae bacterium]|nr:protein kinase [Kofleriaceae bacterium]